METRLRRDRMRQLAITLMAAVVCAGLIGVVSIERGYAQPTIQPPLSVPPQFGPLQFVLCKAAAGDGRSFTVFLPGTGQPEGFGKLATPFLDCGPFAEPEPNATTTDVKCATGDVWRVSTGTKKGACMPSGSSGGAICEDGDNTARVDCDGGCSQVKNGGSCTLLNPPVR